MTVPKDFHDGSTTGEVPAPPPCPECCVGKHGNCDGRTWDDVTDETTGCPCYDAGHGGPRD
jgi:hypothetical protein